jgi:antitoxin VapB
MKRAIAKVFNNGGRQPVRIPKQYRFTCAEVFIERKGNGLVLTPRPRSWKEYFATAPRLPSDFPDAPGDPLPEEVKPL